MRESCDEKFNELSWFAAEEYGRCYNIGINYNFHGISFLAARTDFMADVMSSSVIPTDDAQEAAASIKLLNSARSGSGMGFSSMLVSSLKTMSFTPGVIPRRSRMDFGRTT